MGLYARKPVFGFVNNKGADQPVHPRRLINSFVIRFLESTISRLATWEFQFSSIKVSVAEETGLSLLFSETLKTGFVAFRPIKYQVIVSWGTKMANFHKGQHLDPWSVM